MRVQRTLIWDGWTRLACPSRAGVDRAYVVGPWKTGTATVASLFASRHAAHEPEVWTVYRELLALKARRISHAEVVRRLKVRDRMLGLRIESNAVLGLLTPYLIEAFPQARFVLTVRDPVSWLESWINQAVFGAGRGLEPWESFRRLFFAHHPYESHDEGLSEKGLFSLRGYMSYWSEHYQTVLQCLPKHQLFTVRLEDLDDALPALSDFLGLPLPSRPDRVNTRPEKRYRLRELVNMDDLSRIREEECSEAERALEVALNCRRT